MTLQQTLDTIRREFEGQVDRPTLETLHRVTAERTASGQAARAIGKGDVAPAFALADTAGAVVSLDDVRARGPVVLTFFRGHW